MNNEFPINIIIRSFELYRLTGGDEILILLINCCSKVTLGSPLGSLCKHDINGREANARLLEKTQLVSYIKLTDRTPGKYDRLRMFASYHYHPSILLYNLYDLYLVSEPA